MLRDQLHRSAGRVLHDIAERDPHAGGVDQRAIGERDVALRRGQRQCSAERGERARARYARRGQRQSAADLRHRRIRRAGRADRQSPARRQRLRASGRRDDVGRRQIDIGGAGAIARRQRALVHEADRLCGLQLDAPEAIRRHRPGALRDRLAGDERQRTVPARNPVRRRRGAPRIGENDIGRREARRAAGAVEAAGVERQRADRTGGVADREAVGVVEINGRGAAQADRGRAGEIGDDRIGQHESAGGAVAAEIDDLGGEVEGFGDERDLGSEPIGAARIEGDRRGVDRHARGLAGARRESSFPARADEDAAVLRRGAAARDRDHRAGRDAQQRAVAGDGIARSPPLGDGSDRGDGRPSSTTMPPPPDCVTTSSFGGRQSGCAASVSISTSVATLVTTSRPDESTLDEPPISRVVAPTR